MAKQLDPGYPGRRWAPAGLSLATVSARHGLAAQERRSVALTEAVAEASGVADGEGRSVVAARGFGGGRVALALGGRFDRAAVEELDALLRWLRALASVELVIDLGGLGLCHPQLGRVLGRARIWGLIDGATVALFRLPPDLAEELDLPTSAPATPPAGTSSRR
jgi:hypothetical protein